MVMTYPDEEFLGKLQAAFRGESEEHLLAISCGLLELEKSPDAPRRAEIIASIFRDAHSLKGAARAVNLPQIEMICQALESVFSAWKKRDVSADPELLDPLHRAVKTVEKLLPTAEGAPPPADHDELFRLQDELARLEVARPARPQEERSGRAAQARPADKIPAATSDEIQRSTGQASPPALAAPPQPAPESPQATPDQPPTDAAAASGATRRGSRDRGSHPRSTPVSPTLRIAAAKLDALLLHCEELLALKLNANQGASDLHGIAMTFTEWEKHWAALTSDVGNLRQLIAGGSGKKSGSMNKIDACLVPVSLAVRLLEFLEWNQSLIQSTEDHLRNFSKLADRHRHNTAARVDGLLDEAKRLLMLPFATLFAVFPKLVRELSRDIGKEVELRILGAETEIDKRILDDLKDPLIHLLRNSIDHGIERPERRITAGKPACGTIELAVSQADGNKVEILISDDGGGIDAAKVRTAAVRHGMLTQTEAEKLPAHQALALIFEPEVSTSEAVTEISGRGLGLAIVREKVEKLGGRVILETRPGLGTSFRLLLPLTLATFRGILVEVVQQVFVLPTANVQRVTSVRPEDVKTVEGREMIVLDNKTVSLVRLEDLLDLPRRSSREGVRFMPAVVVESADKRIAMRVDAVLSEQEVLVKPLGKPLERVRNIAGATVLGSGHAVPILNVTDLVKSAMRIRPAPLAAHISAPVEVRPRKSILVVEDSITARMLLKNILEGAGHRVKTAVDGVDAFAILRSEEFDLVVSDVEMPRMNGFDLTAAIRRHKRLGNLPVVLVTALASREDRERGADAGANAYIVKGSFDQSDLLEAVRRLV